MTYTDETKVIGHGGMGITHDFPLNSFESIALCLHKGADGVEMDVQMTKDSVLVAYHDRYLESSLDASGSIYDMNWEQAKSLEYDKLLYTEYKLVRLEDIFQNLPEFRDKTFFFDMKTFSPDTTGEHLQTMLRQTVRLIDKYKLSQPVIEVKSEALGKAVKQLNPSLRVFIYKNFDDGFRISQSNNFEGITIDVDLLTQDQVNKADSVGLEIAVLNTHSRERNDLAHTLEVAYNQTDMVSYVMRQYK